MKLRNLHIHNYRSIANQKINFNDYPLLIGANNTGKSNVIDALRRLYEKDLKFNYERDFPKFPAGDSETWIEIEYELIESFVGLVNSYMLDGNSMQAQHDVVGVSYFGPVRAKENHRVKRKELNYIEFHWLGNIMHDRRLHG